MLDADALAEVETALERGASRTARKALGFREIAAHLAGELDLEEAASALERRHLAYVKRQLTWMRKLADVEIDRPHGPRCAARLPRRSSRAARLDFRAVDGDPEVREMAGARQRLRDRRARRAAVRAHARARAAHLRAALRRRLGRRAAARADPGRALRRLAADLQSRRVRGRAVGQRRARGDPLPAPPRAGPTRTSSAIETAAGRGHGRRSPRTRDLPRRDGPGQRSTSPDFPSGGRGRPRHARRRRGGSSSSSTSASATRSA